ncbi:Oxidored-FMN domain-containing protein [Aphelenchoides besseyi]|nr:Oxidored-FMN domain-containing protein [Aphelenchoides besseyi]KAI6195254.1 Oxidored-FMN domain-containing protein [Aphelenchoides besseyi]
MLVRHSVSRRFDANQNVDSAVLAKPLHLQPSSCVVRNRLMKASLTEYLATFDANDIKKLGLPTERLLNLYTKFGRGGFGLLLTGNVVVHPRHLEAPGNLVICVEGETTEQRFLFQQMAKNAAADGTLVVMQINHAGPRTPVALNPNPLVASKTALTGDLREQAVEATIEQIRSEIVERFAYAAQFAYECGFHGVQIHGGYGWILSSFIGKSTNKRTDHYGGSVENRLRVLREVREEIRARIPKSANFIVGLKLNSPTFETEFDVAELTETAVRLDSMGFDFIELTGGNGEKLASFEARASTVSREAFFDQFLEIVRPQFKQSAVILTGGYRTVHGMTTAIVSGKCDAIGLGRPIAAEPDLPRKILEHNIKSAAYSDSEIQNNFQMSKFKANSQLGQASRSSESSDICDGISDFSDSKESERYERELAAFFQAGGFTPATFSSYFDYLPPC